jgi:hypothetical protein
VLRVVALAAVLAVSSPNGRAVACDVPGDWPHTPDAAWLAGVLRRAGYRDVGCTGSAFDVAYEFGVPRHDFYIWAVTAPRLRPEIRQYRIVAGVRVYGNTVRVAWRAGRRNVWVEEGATARKLPPLRVLERLIRAAVTSR